MPGLMHRAVAFLLLASCSPAGFATLRFTPFQTQQRPAKKSSSATVSGRVTTNGKGRAGITVGLRAAQAEPEFGKTYKAVSDSDGNYRISNVPAGSYRIVPLSSNYVAADLVRGWSMGKTLIIGEGENIEGIDFSVVRGAVVTGKITDNQGRPVAEERVHVVPADSEQQQRPSFSNFMTDDRGIFRVFGLNPGRYKVYVGSTSDGFLGAVGRARTSYAQTYYVDPIRPEEPKILELGEGTEATNIDITVAPGDAGFSATAMVVDSETNKPVSGVRFVLQRIVGDDPVWGPSMMTNARGELRYDNVIPGQYAIALTPEIGSELYAEPVKFNVAGGDVSGLVVKVTRGAVVTGVVTIEGTSDKTVAAKLAQSRLIAFVRGGGGNYGRSANLGADGSFRIGGLSPGLVNFQVISAQRMDEPLQITRVERDGVVQQPGLQLKEREQVSGVKLVIVTGSATVTGTFKLENGPAPPGTRFMVRLEKPGERLFNLRPNEIDARGHFVINNVVPGTYDVVVMGYVPQSRIRPPTARQSITVTEGAVTNVELSLDLNASPVPQPTP